MDIVGGGGDVRLDSHNNLRDFLRIREEDHQQSGAGARNRSNCSGLTLLAVLTETRGPSPQADAPRRPSVQSTRTLLDVIREDRIPGVGQRSWRQLRDRIRLRRGGNSSAVHRMVIAARRSARFTSNLHPDESSPSEPNVRVSNFPANSSEETAGTSGRLSTTEDIEERVVSAATSATEQPARTSLMALLENDWQLGSEVSAHTLREEIEEELDDEEAEISAAAAAPSVEEDDDASSPACAGYNNCCVCMVRHKGAAFIPCGHTFCRLCSRELWVQRGHCPLCNNYILEILDIF